MFEFGLKIKTAVLRVLILAGVGLGMAAGAEATPVTFAFGGEVVNVEELGNPSFDLPANIEIGGPARLLLTFEPIPFPDAAETTGPFTTPGGSTVLFPAGVRLSLGSIILMDDIPTIFVSHDQLSPSTGGGPTSIIEAESIDIRGLGALSIQNEIQWRTEGGFANMGSVFEGGEDLSAPEIWNQLPLRSIIATFSGPGDGLFRVTVSLGDAFVVPEPSNAVSAVLVALMAVAFGRCSSRIVGGMNT